MILYYPICMMTISPYTYSNHTLLRNPLSWEARKSLTKGKRRRNKKWKKKNMHYESLVIWTAEDLWERDGTSGRIYLPSPVVSKLCSADPRISGDSQIPVLKGILILQNSWINNIGFLRVIGSCFNCSRNRSGARLTD